MFTLKVSPEYSKPELKQILENLYNLHVDKIMTVNWHGKLKKSFDKRENQKTPPYKKVFVVLKHNVGVVFRTQRQRSLKPVKDSDTILSDREEYFSNDKNGMKMKKKDEKKRKKSKLLPHDLDEIIEITGDEQEDKPHMPDVKHHLKKKKLAEHEVNCSYLFKKVTFNNHNPA